MAYSLQQILGHIPLTKAIRTNAAVPNPFPKEFFTTSEDGRVRGDKVQYIRITSERRTAQATKYNSPSKSRNLKEIGEQSVRMVHVFENIRIDANMLLQLRSFDQFTQDKGKDWLNHQLTEAGRRIGNSVLVSTASVLRAGEIYVDSDGNFLPTSSGASETYTFNVPATHKTTINGIVSASWALANTDIPGQLRALRQYGAQETGMQLKTALYGINIPRYMMANDFVQAHLVRMPSMNEKFLETGEIPEGLFGFRWIPVYDAFIEKADATNAELWDDDLVTFAPDISQPDDMDWWTAYEGSFMVPRNLTISRSGQETLNNLEETYGMFSYGNIELDPPGATVRYGHTWLPGLRNEKALFMADTTP